jgi:hypothetical protein
MDEFRKIRVRFVIAILAGLTLVFSGFYLEGEATNDTSKGLALPAAQSPGAAPTLKPTPFRPNR